MDPKLATLNGGQTLTVSHEPQTEGAEGATESIKVRQIQVRQYEAAFPLVAVSRSWNVGFHLSLLCVTSVPARLRGMTW